MARCGGQGWGVKGITLQWFSKTISHAVGGGFRLQVSGFRKSQDLIPDAIVYASGRRSSTSVSSEGNTSSFDTTSSSTWEVAFTVSFSTMARNCSGSESEPL